MRDRNDANRITLISQRDRDSGVGGGLWRFVADYAVLDRVRKEESQKTPEVH